MNYIDMVQKINTALRGGEVAVRLNCGHRKMIGEGEGFPLANLRLGIDYFFVHCPECGGARSRVVEVLHPLWHEEINATEVLEADGSRIPVGLKHSYGKVSSILVATASGGYEIWPPSFEDVSELEDYFLNSRDWIHSLRETSAPDEWLRPEYSALPSLETGKEWKDQWGTPHPVIVNAYDWIKKEAATYKVGAAVFKEVPAPEDVASRWDCNVPINKVSM